MTTTRERGKRIKMKNEEEIVKKYERIIMKSETKVLSCPKV